MGHTGSSDGAWAMDPAGTHVWKIIQVGVTWRLSCRALSTPWDLTSGSTNSIIDMPAPWTSTNAVFNSDLWASADGTVLYHWYGVSAEALHRISLTEAYTPASGITVTRDTTVWSDGTPTKAAWAPDMTRMWTWNRIGTSTGSIFEYVQA